MKKNNFILGMAMGVLLFLSGCKGNLIDAMQPVASKDIKQAKARLMAVPKWTIDQALENDVVIYQNGVNLSADNDIDIDFVRFNENGFFEVKYRKEPTDENLRWSIDEKLNTLSIYDLTNKDYREDWTIETGNVYSNSYTMSYVYSYTNTYPDNTTKEVKNKMTIKMKVLD